MNSKKAWAQQAEGKGPMGANSAKNEMAAPFFRLKAGA